MRKLDQVVTSFSSHSIKKSRIISIRAVKKYFLTNSIEQDINKLPNTEATEAQCDSPENDLAVRGKDVKI